MRYSASEKYEIIRLVEASSLSVRQTLRRPGCNGGRKSKIVLKQALKAQFASLLWPRSCLDSRGRAVLRGWQMSEYR